MIWTGLACQVLAILAYTIVQALPSAPFWSGQEAYEQTLGLVPRIAIASIFAYFCGEFVNSYVLSKMKYLAGGKRGFSQVWRFIASTIAGEGIDTLIFVTIAFGGLFTSSQLIALGLSTYAFKVAYEIILTPLTSRFSNWVKKVEEIDQIDTPEETDYNPFRILSK